MTALDVAQSAEQVELAFPGQPIVLLLVGHGFGAAVAGAFAAYYPERLAGLLYVDAMGALRQTPTAEREAWMENFSAAKYGAFHEHWFAPLLLEAKSSTTLRVMNTLRTSRREAIVGQRPKLSRSIAPHASHWLMLDAPQWFHSDFRYRLLAGRSWQSARRWLGHGRPAESARA